MGHYVSVYLMNFGTQKLYGTTMFGTRHIFAAFTRSYKSTPSIALILASNVVILSWSILLDDLVLWDSFANVYTTAGVGTSIVGCTLDYVGDPEPFLLLFLQAELLLDFKQKWQVYWKNPHQSHSLVLARVS